MNLYEIYFRSGERQLVLAKSTTELTSIPQVSAVQLVCSSTELEKVAIILPDSTTERVVNLTSSLKQKDYTAEMRRFGEALREAIPSCKEAAKRMHEASLMMNLKDEVPPDLTYAWITADAIGVGENYLSWLASRDKICKQTTEVDGKPVNLFKRKLYHGVN